MRNRYNLSHLAHIAGHIGRLQTISVIPVVPGDSIEININGIFRLAPTRKEIVSECQLDICAFFVPHRHVYGDDWVEAITEGLQNDVTITGVTADADSRDPFYLGIKTCGATINRATVQGYNRIYQRYFAPPTMGSNQTWTFTNLDFYPNGTTSDLINHRRYGALAARLPHILNGFVQVNQLNAGGFEREYLQGDWGVEIPDAVPDVGILDIRDLKQIQSRYRSVQQQNYFAQFYNDVIAHKWSTSGVNSDADPRPTYLNRETMFISGTDVNGTDDATLGSFIGKTLDRIRFTLSRRFLPEHGNVWLMMLPRFPLVHTKEQHPLLVDPDPDWKLLTGDPTVWAGEPVVPFDPSNWLSGGSAITPNIAIAQQPYGQEYRYQPNRIHPVFEEIPGYPFTSWDSSGYQAWMFYNNNEFANVFQTSQIAQWQAHMSVGCTKFSTIPDPKTSIFAGA